ncbi:MAG: DegT/DnrJ/EryC1/StrS family aminotransferase [Deltaproteobacteria bacterium]|nr:DegT/DnrJ/EryC1/StrS family aminotransferase [Deltaproteobacteria bacterium]
MPGYEWIGAEEKGQVNQVLDTGVLFRYEFMKERSGVYKVKEFEEKFASYTGAPHAHAVTSGSAALKVALAALGIRPGDEVITQGFTFIATFEAIIEAGAVPIPAEIDETLNMDPEDFERKITSRTKAVIPVHMLGSPARIKEIVAIAGTHGIKVIEDTAQALGAEVEGKKLGTLGDMGTFSFDFYKTITTGEGGMVVTSDRDLYIRASEYADHGHDHNPSVGRALDGRNFLGFNYRMNELNGAVGLAQLNKLDAIIRRQEQNQAPISKTLESIPGVTLRKLPESGRESFTHICFFLPDGEKAARFHRSLVEKGVTVIYFKNNLWHFLPNWEHVIEKKTAWPGPYPFGGPLYPDEITYSKEMLPGSTAIIDRLLVIPVFLNTSQDQLAGISKALMATAKEVV